MLIDLSTKEAIAENIRLLKMALDEAINDKTWKLHNPDSHKVYIAESKATLKRFEERLENYGEYYDPETIDQICN